MNPIILALGGLRATAFAGLALALGLALGVQTLRHNAADAALTQARLDAATAKAAALQSAREIEQQHTKDFAALAGRLVTENEDAKAEADRLLAGLRDGTERLRRRFSCPAAGVPANPGAPGGDHAAEAGGLRDEDAAFLVREAERADATARQLSACQATLRQVVAASRQVPK